MSPSEYLPQSPGWLPIWLLFISTLALGNCFQAYLTLHFTSQIYNGPSSTPSKANPSPQVTPLQSRTFGSWTLLSSLIRIYAAYNITDPVMYQLALLSYMVAWGHFMSEWLVFGTASWGRGLAGPVVVANVSLVWMVWGLGFYLP